MKNWLPIRRMRFRFRLRTLLLAPLVFVAGWWWITWPSRTVRNFNGLVAAMQSDAAASYLVFHPDLRITPETVAVDLRAPFVAPLPRNLADMIFARQRYELLHKFNVLVEGGADDERLDCVSVTVERGFIKYEWGKAPNKLPRTRQPRPRGSKQ